MANPSTPVHDPPELSAWLAEAEQFLAAAELAGTTTAGRVTAVLAEIRGTGTYWHAERELAWGAKLAWRNAISCIGRSAWRSLIVRDRRVAVTPDDIAEACIEHLATASTSGRVRPVLTVFAPATGGRAVRILNSQLIGYAGYQQADGTVIGDPKNIELTALATSLGWLGTGGSGGRFDVLPLLIHTGGQRPRCYRLPDRVVHEVPITHPDLPQVAGLGLRWYAHPAISNQRLRIGGIDYPAAPFSGWYTLPEVAVLNLANRYHVLPQLAERIGLDTSTTRTLWRDEALLALSQAVLHSYREHGVTMVDHHTAAAAFAFHEVREHAAGRAVFGDWRALTPALNGAITPLYDRTYEPTMVLPAFFPPDPGPAAGSCPVTGGAR